MMDKARLIRYKARIRKILKTLQDSDETIRLYGMNLAQLDDEAKDLTLRWLFIEYCDSQDRLYPTDDMCCGRQTGWRIHPYSGSL